MPTRRRQKWRMLLCRLFVISLSLCIAGVMSGEALAKKNPELAVKTRDKNGDERVGRDEWEGTAEIFAKIDANGDNYLTVDEFSVHLKALEGSNAGKSKTIIQKMDKDGDGKISRGEWTGQAKFYGQIDADRDARLSVEELTAHIAAAQKSEGGKKSGGKKSDGEKEKKVNLMSAIRSFDKNRDRMLSRDEWTGPEKRFKSADANQDGHLTVFELATAQVKQMDKDGNGKLSRSETPFPKEKFDNLDKSGDDLVSVEEFSADMGWAKVSK